MTFLRVLYTIYATITFILTFLLVFPVFVICAQNKNWHKTAYIVTHYWGRIFLFITGIKLHIENRNDKNWSSPCVYVANHFSYADIASIPQFTKDACFVGKQSIQKVPLFGYYFRLLHITVNRNSLRDRAMVFEKGIAAIKEGKSLIIFPEGGMRSVNPPQQVAYKDGAFKIAVDQGVPIVPITLPYNWKLLPDEKFMYLHGNRIEMVVHEAIETKDLTLDDVSVLKQKVFRIIQQELDKKNLVVKPQMAYEN